MGSRLCVDFDGTFVNTSKAMIKCLNTIIKEEETKIVRDYTCKWDFSDVVSSEYSRFIPMLFESKMFFDNLEFFNGAYETLKELSRISHVTCVSIGSKENIKLKMDWIDKNISFVDFIPIIQNGNIKMDKSCIQMDGAVFIDDHMDNLKSSNATTKILYKNNGIDVDWSKGWNGDVMYHWNNENRNLLHCLLNE